MMLQSVLVPSQGLAMHALRLNDELQVLHSDWGLGRVGIVLCWRPWRASKHPDNPVRFTSQSGGLGVQSPVWAPMSKAQNGGWGSMDRDCFHGDSSQEYWRVEEFCWICEWHSMATVSVQMFIFSSTKVIGWKLDVAYVWKNEIIKSVT